MQTQMGNFKLSFVLLLLSKHGGHTRFLAYLNGHNIVA